MKRKILTLLFLLLLTAGLSIVTYMCYQSFSLLQNENIKLYDFLKNYNQLHTNISYASIILFVVLLIVSLVYYFYYHRVGYVLITNMFYIVTTLFNYITLSKMYADAVSTENTNSEHYFNIFIGIFFIVGGILVSVIGFYAIRNFSKFKRNKIN